MIETFRGSCFQYIQAFGPSRLAWPGYTPAVAVRLIGRFESEGGFINRNRESHFVPHVVESGSGTVSVGRQSWRIGPGDCFVLFPGVVVDYRDEPRNPWKYTWFQMMGPAAAALLAACGFSQAVPVRCNGSYHLALKQILDDGFAALASGTYAPFLPQRLAWQLLEGMQQADGMRQAPDELADRLRSYLQRTCGGDVSIGRLARRLGVSRSTLFRRFQHRFGVSPSAYLFAQRMQLAEQLLADRSLTVSEISRRSGFTSPAYFSRAFLKAHGMPPGRWRAITGI